MTEVPLHYLSISTVPLLMPGSGRAPWVTGKGGGLHSPPLSTGGVELLRDEKANFFNCFVFIHTFENDKYISSDHYFETSKVIVFLAGVKVKGSQCKWQHIQGVLAHLFVWLRPNH